MANSRHQYTGAGDTALYSVPFPYISKAYVKFYQDGVPLVDGTDYTWQTPNSILLSAGNLPSGAILLMRRETPKDTKLVDFNDGSELTEADLDLANDQVFHIAQEASDEIGSALHPLEDGTMDAGNHRIRNVGEPEDHGDAVTKAYVDTVLPSLVAASEASASSALFAKDAAEAALETVETVALSVEATAGEVVAAAEDVATALIQFGALAIPIPVSSGGTGATSVDELKLVLGVGTAAAKDVGTGVGQLPTAEQIQGLVTIPPGVPSGCVAHFAMSSAPTGWLKANGAAVSRTTYADLFAAIGTTFGAGDGSTTFALPDLRGEFVRGLDDGRGVDTGRALGSAQAGSNAPHSHSAGSLSADSGGAHVHTLSGMNSSAGDGFAQTGSGGQGATNSGGAHTHAISGVTGSNGSEARPRNIALLACIKF